MFDLTGRTALVTGAGQNVGAGIARALAAAGATVIVNDVVPDRADASASAIGRGALASAFDITSAAEVAAALATLPPVDILVNNAGIPAEMRPTAFRSMAPEVWRHYTDLNLYGSLNCIHGVLDGMCDRGWGRIVQISSGAGQTGIAMGISLYGASKSAIEGFIRHLSQEIATTGVTANSIALGLMDNVGSEAAARLVRAVPVGRLGSTADVGAAVVYVSSPEASWLTGQTIQLNGGQITT